ncbi:AMP-binding protein [Gordonia humi]|nr:AMP-binding protein [Gordonia humi]
MSTRGIWIEQYTAPRERYVAPAASIPAAFADTVAARPDETLIRYFDGALSVSEVDRLADATAVALAERGFGRGDRAVLYLQNVPQYLIAALGVWRLGGVVVSANPMYKARELGEIVADSGARAVIAMESLHTVVTEVLVEHPTPIVVTTSELEFAERRDGVLSSSARINCPGAVPLADLLAEYAGARPEPVAVGADDLAVLTYTSGTTGPPKGAEISHGNLVFSATTYRDWIGIDADDVIFGVAPMFHITGVVGHAALAMLTGATLVLTYRFDPVDAVETIAEYGATFTVGSITVFIALMNAPNATREKLATLAKIYSGGAPIPPSTLQMFDEAFGHHIHNIYGLTETTSPAVAVPCGRRAPVDARTGAAAVGVPVYDTVVRIVDDAGEDVDPAESGEVVIAGPQVVRGYWNRPDETAAAMPGNALRTGDVGYFDADGWLYLVDRKKDQINASGYKVWPREVEDVLYEHAAVREVAVVGVPDAYRGETVKAFVSLRDGARVTAAELTAYARERLAAYKAPTEIALLDELPKTASGKILRRTLRDAGR